MSEGSGENSRRRRILPYVIGLGIVAAVALWERCGEGSRSSARISALEQELSTQRAITAQALADGDYAEEARSRLMNSINGLAEEAGESLPLREGDYGLDGADFIGSFPREGYGPGSEGDSYAGDSDGGNSAGHSGDGLGPSGLENALSAPGNKTSERNQGRDSTSGGYSAPGRDQGRTTLAGRGGVENTVPTLTSPQQHQTGDDADQDNTSALGISTGNDTGDDQENNENDGPLGQNQGRTTLAGRGLETIIPPSTTSQQLQTGDQEDRNRTPVGYEEPNPSVSRLPSDDQSGRQDQGGQRKDGSGYRFELEPSVRQHYCIGMLNALESKDAKVQANGILKALTVYGLAWLNTSPREFKEQCQTRTIDPAVDEAGLYRRICAGVEVDSQRYGRLMDTFVTVIRTQQLVKGNGDGTINYELKCSK